MDAEHLRQRVWPVQLATLVDDVPKTASTYLYELKFDGYRILSVRIGRELRLFSRSGQDWTNAFDVVAEDVRALRTKEFVIDGEVCALDERGVPSFQLLQNRMGGAPRLAYFVFDLLWAEGEDLRHLPLEERRERLRRLVGKPSKGSRVALSSAVPGDPREILRTACSSGLEGIVAKQKGSPYAGGRQNSWLKIKCTLRQEFAIVGYLPFLGTRRGEVGSLLLALKGADGALHYAGKAGTGFSNETRKTLGKLLEDVHTDQPPVAGAPRLGGIARWSRPKHVAEVAFSEWTSGGHARHPSFQGLRKDKTPDECVRETPTANGDRAREARPSKKKSTGGDDPVVLGVRITHASRVLDPAGVTKLELASYYEVVADRMLPHLRGRPLTLLRWTSDKDSEKGGVYLRHGRAWGPKELRRIRIQEKTKVGEYLVADTPAALVALAQMDILEIHTWNSTADDLERPNRVVFDIDPDVGLAWSIGSVAARRIRERLTVLGLKSFVKTTGGKGLHVVVPLVPGANWDECLDFTRAFAQSLEREFPSEYVASMPKAKRRGKVFIDYLRNTRGSTSVAAYSTRARQGATVSMPIAWEELDDIDPAAFKLETAMQRARQRNDPWKEYGKIRQQLSPAARRKLQ